MGLEIHKPVGYLVLTIILGGVLGTLLSVIGQLRLSNRGEKVIKNLRVKSIGMRTGVSQEEPGSIGMDVALFGVSACVGMSSDLRAWFPRKNTAFNCGSGYVAICGGGSGGADGDGGGCGGGGS
jgi:hypothetical protein